MKNILTVLFLFIAMAAIGQVKEQKPDSVVINLTPLQEQKMAEYDKDIKALQEKSKDLFMFILDVNRIDDKRLLNVDYQPGKLILKLKK